MSPRQIVELVVCDHCKGETTRPLERSEKGARLEQGPLPDGWIAVIRRYIERSSEGDVRKKVDNIYCGPCCAIAALKEIRV